MHECVQFLVPMQLIKLQASSFNTMINLWIMLDLSVINIFFVQSIGDI